MAFEIERKFLVTGDHFKKHVKNSAKIVQGYLSSAPERAVRIRIKENTGYINIKGLGNKSGTTRYEWERKINLKDAEELLKICEPGIIDKVRYFVEAGNHTFEIDVFYGDNNGLIIAEVELQSEHEDFEKPSWLGEEVTGNEKYYNLMLMKNPFKNWRDE